MQFSKRLDRFGEEIFAALNNRRMELEQQGMKIYNMSVGTPDFKTPEHIKKALAEAAMDDNNWKYSLRDLPELLEAVCEYYKKRFDVELTPDMVMTVYGSQEGMGHLGMALCDEGDVVLLPDPCYPVFAAGSLMAGAVPYYYPLVAEHDFLPYVKDIPEEVAKKAKYMVVSLPSNPVGSIATPGLYEEIVAFARKYDILIIHDNAYSDIIFDGAYGGSFLATEGAKEIGVEFFSLSKSFNVTGARISFLVGRPDVIAALRKLRSQIDFGMFLPIQGAVPDVSGEKRCPLQWTQRDRMGTPEWQGNDVCLGQNPERTDGQYGVLHGTDGKSRCDRDTGSKLRTSWRGLCTFRSGASAGEDQRSGRVHPQKRPVIIQKQN